MKCVTVCVHVRLVAAVAYYPGVDSPPKIIASSANFFNLGGTRVGVQVLSSAGQPLPTQAGPAPIRTSTNSMSSVTEVTEDMLLLGRA